jgi:hypothetical protein
MLHANMREDSEKRIDETSTIKQFQMNFHSRFECSTRDFVGDGEERKNFFQFICLTKKASKRSGPEVRRVRSDN